MVLHQMNYFSCINQLENKVDLKNQSIKIRKQKQIHSIKFNL